MNEQLLDVWLIDPGTGPLRAGQLLIRGEEAFFRYLGSYLGLGSAFPIDPINLALSGKIFTSRLLRPPLLIFDDILPDTWGLAILSKKHGYDFFKDRMAALSHMETSVVGGLVCLPQGTRPKMPKWIPMDYLNECLYEVKSFEIRKADFIFKYLGITGTSAGGARPKASFVDKNGIVWLVKFPSHNDPTPETISKVEYAGYAFAKRIGLSVPEAKTIEVGDATLFASRRFDIIAGENGHRRLIVLSLSTLLGGMHMADVGYEKAAAVMRRHLQVPEQDILQFFRHMLLNWCIVNTDDHLKNISLLWDGVGLRLSPAYDLVGNLWGLDHHTMTINSKASGIGPSDIYKAGKRMRVKDILSEMKKAVASAEIYLEEIGKVEGTGQLAEMVERRLEMLSIFLKRSYKLKNVSR